MNKKPQRKKLLLIILIFGIAFFKLSILNIKAVTVPTTSEVYQSAPDGLKLGGLVDLPATYKDGTKNNAKLVTDFPVNIIQMLSSKVDGGAQSQVSSFWGKYEKDSNPYNSFNLRESQTISAWVYFGDTYHYYNDKPGDDKVGSYGENKDDDKTADGLAFVLQNDNNGAQAISGAIGDTKVGNYYKTAVGESLGVWGTGKSNQDPLSELGLGSDKYNILNKGGIQNSFALEFDAVNNYTFPSSGNGFTGVDGKDDGFDFSANVKGQHIAYAYPGESSTYQQDNNFIMLAGRTVYNNKLVHTQGKTGNNIEMTGYTEDANKNVGKSWKHITLKYQAPSSSTSTTGTFSYYFNDQNRDGSAKPANEINVVKNIEIDLNKFHSSSGLIRWGFTAATGSQYSEPRTYSIILQQMPNVANVESESKLFDMSQYDDSNNHGREISDLYKDPNYDERFGITKYISNPTYNVSNKDTLKFQYTLNYKSGNVGTGPMTVAVNLPPKVDFKGGLSSDLADQSVGKVTYSGDGATEANSYEIAASDITTDDSGNQVVKLNLDAMKTKGQKAVVELYGIANSSETPVLVENKVAAIRSDTYVEDLSSPAFIINDQPQISTTDDLTQTVDYDKAPSKITGKLQYANGSKVTGATVYTKINGSQVDNNGQMSISSDGLTGNYTLDAPTAASASGSKLHVGKNKIEVYAIDSLRRVSNILEYTINVNDYTNLVLSADKLDYSIYSGSLAQLTSKVKYDTGLSFYSGQLTANWEIDGKDSVSEKISGDSPVTSYEYAKAFNGSNLGVGTHTLTLYISDGTRDSNKVTYTVTVSSKSLVAKSDNTDITVNNNDPVSLAGTFAYTDNSAITSISGAKVTYTIKNGDNVQDPVSFYSKDGKIDISLKPILTPIINSTGNITFLSYNAVETLLSDPKSVGLREGRNEITVTVTDGEYQSNELLFVVNVPKITPELSSKELSYSVKSASTLTPSMTYTYPDESDYLVKPYYLRTFYKQHDSDNWSSVISSAISKTASVTPLDYKGNILGSEIGITTPTTPATYNVDAKSYDPYGRESNVITYNIKVFNKELALSVKDYSFKSINYGYVSDKGLVGRNGKWDVDVLSYNTRWKLYAKQSTDFIRENSDGTSTKMNANMIYVNKDNYETAMNEETLIASDLTGGTVEKNTDISDNWDGDDGILLAVNDVAPAGQYKSTVTWTLVDSPV